MKTIEKLYKQIRHLEVEYGLLLLDRTRRRERSVTAEAIAS